MQNVSTFTLIIIAAVLAVVATFLLFLSPIEKAAPAITNFEECTAAGYPIMESYPEQCRTPDGQTFVRNIATPEPLSTSTDGISFNGCAVAGCSGQLCVSVDEADEIVTTCEYRAEYACYKEASCEPQADGKCGWTLDASLVVCLEGSPSPEDVMPQ